MIVCFECNRAALKVVSIVLFECKRAASKVVSIVLFLIYLLCTWVTCLPVHSRCTGAFMCLCEVTF